MLLPTYQFIRPHISGDIDNEYLHTTILLQTRGGLKTVKKAVTANSKRSLSSLLEAPLGEQVDIPSVTGYTLVSRWLPYLRYLE